MAEYENGMIQIDNRTDTFGNFAVSQKKKFVIICRGSFCTSSLHLCFIHGSRNSH